MNSQTPSPEWFRLVDESEIPSPALLLFSERIDANLRLMIEIAGGPERLRPHVKTHKLAPLVERQIALGITRFKAATIAESEMCAEAGAAEVLLAFPPVGPNGARLCELARRFPNTRFATIADTEEIIGELSGEAHRAGIILDVLLDLDCGMHRTGVEPGPRAAALYRLITQTKTLRAAGLHAYDGHIKDLDPAVRRARCDEAFAPVVALRDELFADGLAVPVLIAGGCPTFPCHAQHADRQLSPGTSVLWDFDYADKFPDLPFLPAAVLLTRVVSRPGLNRLCLDLGHKAVAAETTGPHVRLLELPDATPIMHSEEHLVIESARAEEITIGDTLHGIPRHICPTMALHSEVWLVEDGVARQPWPVTARARRLNV